MNKKRGTIQSLVGLLILLVIPLVYAGDYGTGAYSAGKYGIGATEEEREPAEISPGGGGAWTSVTSKPSKKEITYECIKDKDCKPNQYCFEYKCYDAECLNDKVCKADEVCWNYRCVKLFDIKIIDFESPVKLGEFFDFSYLIKGMADINGDVIMHFWIEKDGVIITSGSDTIYLGSFEEKTETTKLFLPSDTVSGTYNFKIQLNHGTYIAEAHRTIEIKVSDGIAEIKPIPEIGIKDLGIYIISILTSLAILILCFIFYQERKKIKVGIIKEEKWIKKHKVTVAALGLFIILGIIIYYLKDIGITSLYYLYYLIGLIVLVTVIIISKKKYVAKGKKKRNKRGNKGLKVKKRGTKRK